MFSSVHPAAPPPPSPCSPPPSPSLWCGTAPSARPPGGGLMHKAQHPVSNHHSDQPASLLLSIHQRYAAHIFCHVCAHLWRYSSIHFCTCNSIQFWFIPIKHLFHTQSALYVNPQHGNFLPTESAVSGIKLKMHMECPLEMHLETQPSALFCPLTAASQTGAFSADRQRSGGREAQHMEVWTVEECLYAKQRKLETVVHNGA